jgi:predicted aconitase
MPMLIIYTIGSVGTAPLFHMANITPEAMGNDKVDLMLHSCGEKRVDITMDMLRKSYMTLDSGNDGNDDVSLVALGNPHLRYVQLITKVLLFEIILFRY